MISFRPLTDVENQRYQDWRSNHPCISQVEFRITPDSIDQATRVRCWKCGEQIELTDFDAG